jgi:hypothetical protein
MKEKMTRRHFLESGVAGTVSRIMTCQADSRRPGQGTNRPATRAPNFEDYASIEAYTGGFPVYSLGNIAYIYGVSPDLCPDAIMQEGNTNPKVKIKPKKSWEIKRNPFGVTIAEPGPRTMWNDSQPMLPIHLIDGDPDTAWSSYGSQVPDARTEWIRIDLPVETTVTAVVLVCSQDFAAAKLWEQGKLTDLQDYHKWAGRALPNELIIQVSRDACHWETVYEDSSFSGNDSGPAILVLKPTEQNANNPRVIAGKGAATVIEFSSRPAKQILITGRNFKRRLDKYVGYAFSLGEVEVWDSTGQNVALLSRGAGVTVSSTSCLMEHDRLTQLFLFGSVQYDLGLKYIRLGADNGLYTWNYVERERGKMQVDSVADETITELHRNGISVIMNLDVKANFAYKGRKLDWRQARFREANNIYYDHPGWCWETPEMFQGYLRYVDFMVGHFKGRVAYYEIGNEWSDAGPARAIRPQHVYAQAVHRIKRIDPKARIMVGVGMMSEFPGLLERFVKDTAASGEELALLMPDAVGSHPTTRVDAGLTLNDLDSFYWQENRRVMQEARALGYKGIYIASEVYTWSLYPPGPEELNKDRPRVASYYGESEIVRAKFLARNLVGHAGLNMLAFYTNTYFVSASVGQSLFRVPTPCETLNTIQPDTGYYVLRTLSTVLEDWAAAEFRVTFSSGKRFTTFTFQRGDRELMVATYLQGDAADHVVETDSDIILPGVQAEEVWVIDVLNGAEQKLNFTVSGSNTVIKGVLLKDYPVLVRLSY